jgi:hypothetical protein
VRPGRGGIKLSAAKEQLEKLASCHELPRIILEQRRLAGALAKTVAPLLAVCRQHPKVELRFLDSYIPKESDLKKDSPFYRKSREADNCLTAVL